MVLGGWKYFKKGGAWPENGGEKMEGVDLVDQGILNQCRMNFMAVEEWVFILVDETHGQL